MARRGRPTRWLLDGLTVAQVARRTGLSAWTVRSRVRQVLAERPRARLSRRQKTLLLLELWRAYLWVTRETKR